MKNVFEGQKNGSEKTSKDAITVERHMQVTLRRMRRGQQKRMEVDELEKYLGSIIYQLLMI